MNSNEPTHVIGGVLRRLGGHDLDGPRHPFRVFLVTFRGGIWPAVVHDDVDADEVWQGCYVADSMASASARAVQHADSSSPKARVVSIEDVGALIG